MNEERRVHGENAPYRWASGSQRWCSWASLLLVVGGVATGCDAKRASMAEQKDAPIGQGASLQSASPMSASTATASEEGVLGIGDRQRHAYGRKDKSVERSPDLLVAPPAASASPGGYAAAPPREADFGGGEIAIDPNGRFATTYRPGAGHLAAFESAIARGIIPASEREVVSDIGMGYSASIDKPKDHALAFRADFERTALPPSGGTVHLRLDLQSTAQAPKERPHLSVVVVLDVSGSMRGELISSARQAASELVDRLDPGDQFSLVTFSSDANVLIPMESVGVNRSAIKQTIAKVQEGGGTNISEGLRLGYAELHKKAVPDDAERVTFLLSDGRANDGITNVDMLSKLALDAFQDGIQTSSFGLGTDYDGPLMSHIAENGAGGYYYLRDGAQIAPALSTELDKRLEPVATALEVRIRLKPGVELLEAYGSRKLTQAEAANVRVIEVAQDHQAQKNDHIKANRQNDVDGGMRFFIPAFARDESHAILLKLRLPAGVSDKEVALLEVKYKDRVTKANVADEIPIKVAYASSDADSARTIDASVTRTVQGFQAGDALMRASRAIAMGDVSGADRILLEREGILRQASETLGEPLLAKDADRLARLRDHVEGKKDDPLVLAMMMETAGNTRMR